MPALATIKAVLEAKTQAGYVNRWAAEVKNGKSI